MKTEEFIALNRIDKRKAIAKEVLLLITQNKISAKRGTYISGYGDHRHDTLVDVISVDTNIPHCEVCAIGAAAVSICMITHSQKSIAEVHGIACGYEAANDLLSKYFSYATLKSMESVFEDQDFSQDTDQEAMLYIWEQIAETGDFND